MNGRKDAVSPAEYRAAAALRAGLRQFSQGTEEVLKRLGLTAERYELLLSIKAADDDQGMTVSELAVVLGLAQSSVTQMVRRVEDAGLLVREVSSSDARVRYLRLTKFGARQLSEAVSGLREERTRLASVVQRS